MSSNQLPVLTLDFSDEKIQKLQSIANQFKNALNGQPGAPLPVPRPRPIVKPGGAGPKGFMESLDKEAKATLKTFSLINKTLKVTTSTLKGLFSMTVSWGAKLAALAVGGPFGFNLMARHTTQQFMGAQGLNMSIGQVQAAHNIFGNRFSSTDAAMQALSAAQRNPGSQEYRAILALGLRPEDAPGQNLPKFYAAIDRIRKQYGSGALQWLQGAGVNFADSTMLNQVAANSSDIPMLGQQYLAQSRTLNSRLSPRTQKSYQDTTTSLSFSADRMMNSFKTAIANLNGPIAKLSSNLTDSVDQFLNGPNGKALFKTIADGLKSLGDWLGSSDFQNDLKAFSECIKEVIRIVGAAIKWIGDKAPGLDITGAGTGKDRADSALVKFGNKYLDGKLPGANPMTNKYTGMFSQDAVYRDYQMPDAMKGNIQNFVRLANKTYHLPTGLMTAVATRESSWNPFARNKASGASGLFQFMPGTAKAYGLQGDDVFDPNKATAAAGKYFHDLDRRYHGDVAKMLTAYNGGRIDKDGNLSLRMETVKYLMKILPQVQGATEQHPFIMHQLKASEEYLQRAPAGSRSTIHLMVEQKPGADYTAQVNGAVIPH